MMINAMIILIKINLILKQKTMKVAINSIKENVDNVSMITITIIKYVKKEPLNANK